MSFVQHKRLGLALGGGGARGLAHIGVLQVLAEAGIEIHAVVGTSVGSLIGAAVAAGLPLDELSARARSVRWWHLARPAWPQRGFVSFLPLERYMVNMLGNIQIEDMPLPYACLAMDALTGAVTAFRSGRLAERVRASCSVPVAVKPIEIEGVVYVDGGMVDNLPIKFTRELGVDVVLAVNLYGPPSYLPTGIFAYAHHILGHTLVQAGDDPHSADVLVEPDCTGYGLVRFAYDDLVELGRGAMTAKLDELRQMVG